MLPTPKKAVLPLLACLAALALCGAARAADENQTYTGEELTFEAIKPHLEAAGYAVAPPDEDGDIKVTKAKEEVACWLTLSKANIRFWDGFRFNDDVEEIQKLRLVNNFNRTSVGMSAYVLENLSGIIVEYYLWTDAGLTPKQIMNSFDWYFAQSKEKLVKLNNEYKILK